MPARATLRFLAIRTLRPNTRHRTGAPMNATSSLHLDTRDTIGPFHLAIGKTRKLFEHDGVIHAFYSRGYEIVHARIAADDMRLIDQTPLAFPVGWAAAPFASMRATARSAWPSVTATNRSSVWRWAFGRHEYPLGGVAVLVVQQHASGGALAGIGGGWRRPDIGAIPRFRFSAGAARSGRKHRNHNPPAAIRRISWWRE